MSYNSIGLSTPRGSGTNGYITANAAHLKREPFRYGINNSDSNNKKESNKLISERKADKEILRHEEKRFIELQCMELQDRLEAEAEADLEDDVEDTNQEAENKTIQLKVSQLRNRLMAELEAKWAHDDNKHFTERGYEPRPSKQANHVHDEIDKLLADVSSHIAAKKSTAGPPETQASHSGPESSLESRRRSRSPPPFRRPRSRTPSPIRSRARRGPATADLYRPGSSDRRRRDRVNDDDDDYDESSPPQSRRDRGSSSSYRPRYRESSGGGGSSYRPSNSTNKREPESKSESRSDRYKPHQTHEIARAKERENNRLRDALRLSN